jgi:hypothetical protein
LWFVEYRPSGEPLCVIRGGRRNETDFGCSNLVGCFLFFIV